MQLIRSLVYHFGFLFITLLIFNSTNSHCSPVPVGGGLMKCVRNACSRARQAVTPRLDKITDKLDAKAYRHDNSRQDAMKKSNELANESQETLQSKNELSENLKRLKKQDKVVMKNVPMTPKRKDAIKERQRERKNEIQGLNRKARGLQFKSDGNLIKGVFHSALSKGADGAQKIIHNITGRQ